MSGLEVLEKVARRLPEVYVIAITAHQSMESTIQAIKLGAFDYIHKPIDISEMDSVIERLEQVASASQRINIEAPQPETEFNEKYSQIIQLFLQLLLE